MPTEIEKVLGVAEGHLRFYRHSYQDLRRIQNLVQDNLAFFGGTKVLGQSSIKIAADRLEQLVQEWKEGCEK